MKVKTSIRTTTTLGRMQKQSKELHEHRDSLLSEIEDTNKAIDVVDKTIQELSKK